MMDDASGLLLVGIEVSVALAGFAGIVATFQFRDESKVKRGDLVALTMLVTFSLRVCFLCALSLVLGLFRMGTTTIWGVSSAFAAGLVLHGMWFVHKRMHPVRMRPRTRRLFVMLQSAAFAVVALNVMNSANLGFHREPGPYFVLLGFVLFLVGYSFIRLLVRPLWKVVQAQEAQNVRTE